jgi:hypothetical protein
MALKFLDRQEALDEFHGELLPWVKNSQLRDLYSKVETEKYVKDCVKWAIDGGSKTAFDLWTFVYQANELIRVVGMKGGFQCFGTAEGNKKVPVVFIDLDGILNFKNRVSMSEHNLAIHQDALRALRKGTYKLSTVNPKERKERYEARGDNVHVSPQDFKGQIQDLSNRIAILHELGHAKQFIERPRLFTRPMKPAGSEIQKLAMERAQRNMGRTDEFKSDPNKIATVADIKDVRPLAWDAVVEMDNMDRHEWPICREMKIPYRKNYCDLGGTTGAAAAQPDTLIERKINDIEEKERQAALEKDKELKAATSGEYTCKGNPKLVITGSLRINSHKLSCPSCKTKYDSV